ncbi:hypothetical protein FEM48_Zijuj05G0101600 [Ziziphus jujuba var. spinosa]|uniref:Uncharacterized protein n=1 Tax=Ziziphus jujuba var. spinosa TaxID=714518 RepID=A0A978VEC5_ZIZJJ|nr:hypothetical protein FEM48_Zijuj05G0101600 [Ziziphus jujuba var. spinosa]
MIEGQHRIYTGSELRNANGTVENSSMNCSIKVSSKSDVYSYGMMNMEMVGGRRNLETEKEPTYRPYMNKVIEMLGGRLEALHIPPNHLLSSLLPQAESSSA